MTWRTGLSPAEAGVPLGGTAGQLLAKNSSRDRDTQWVAPSTGDVVGPASAVDGRVAQFDGTTGKLLKDGGLTLSGTNTGDQFTGTTAGVLIGRRSGSAGAAEEITVGSGLTLAGTTLSAAGGSGDVVGPSSAVANNVATFNGTTGKLIKDSGLALAGTNTGDETTTTIGALINAATNKATPVDADHVGLMDSAASNVLKKLSWLNIKATLKAYFDALYMAVGGEVTLANVTLGSAGASLSSGTFAASKFLRVKIWMPSIAASDTPSMQFNADTGNNYRYHWLTNAAGATTWASAANTAATTDRVKIAAADSARALLVTSDIGNDPNVVEKLVDFKSLRGTLNIGTQAVRSIGNGAWISAAATQITRIDLISTSNMAAGTQMVIYGQN